VKRLLNFAAVGVAGAGVHLAGFEFVSRALSLGASSAWLLGFVLAATTTWIMNRLTTFADRSSHRAPGEWAIYMTVAAFGALAHFLVFGFLASPGGLLVETPGLGIIPGSIASFAVTYLGASVLVFPSIRKKP
jgi:putative flippase GtrA